MNQLNFNQNSEKQNPKSSSKDTLVASENRYRRLFESTKEGILILDAETGMIVDVNPFLIELLGYSKENFIKKAIWEIGVFKDVIDNKDKFLELQQNKYVRYEDLPLQTAGGRKINVEFISNVYLINNDKVIQCNIRDITKRKEIEAGLEKTRTELEEIKKRADEESKFIKNIIDTVREPLLVLDGKLRVIKASRSFFNFFRVTPENTIGKPVYELGNQQWDIPKLRELLEKILPEKTTFDNYEVEHHFSTIGTRIMLLNARQIKRSIGNEKIILLAFEDITVRRGVERSLSEKSRMNSEYLRILLEHAHAPIVIWNSSFIIKRFNPEFEKLTGYCRSEVLNKKMEMLLPKNEIESTLGAIKNNIQNENSEVIEINILTKDKKIKTVLWNSANIFDEEGRKIVSTIAQDITLRKRTEEALFNSEIRYRRLFESAQDGILILNSETGMIVDVNPFLIQLLGYSKENFLERTIWEIGFLKDIIDNKEKFLELQQKEYVRYDDLPLETADGKKIHVEFVSNVYLAGNKKVIQCNIRDITERKLAEEEVRESEEKFRMIFDNVFDGISIYLEDPDSSKRRLVECNEQYSVMAGRSRDELFQLGSLLELQIRDEDKATKNRLESLKKGKEYHGSYSWIRPDGKENSIEYVGKPVIWKGKSYTVGIDRDVTAQKQLEKQLIKSKEKAEESDRLKTAFLTNMSHEIRTPMNGILGFASFLKEPGLSSDDQQDYIKIIQ
ncbi:MAG TPA: PAS domain S-box protein, partial [Prolixibacteraceae bacterium]|nr:PAS domain S-box protein [Prolixibacteraceae bacterium]